MITLKTLPERHDHGLGVEDKGDRSVVDEVHLHMGAEPTRLDGRSPFPQLFDDLVDQRLRDWSWGGRAPRRPPPLGRVGVQRELTDNE